MKSRLVNEGYVLMLDMLGFKDRTQANLPSMLTIWQELKAEFEYQACFVSEGFDVKVRTLFISDTIISCFSLKDNDHCDIERLLLCIPDLIQSVFLKYMEAYGIFFRGALSFGSFLYNKTSCIIMGPAVNEAAEWYESANWIGVTLTPSTDVIIQKMIDDDEYPNYWFDDFIRYDIPYKNTKSYTPVNPSKYAINWIDRNTYRFHPEDTVQRVLNTFPPLDHNSVHKDKYNNTKKFILYSLKYNFTNRNQPPISNS